LPANFAKGRVAGAPLNPLNFIPLSFTMTDQNYLDQEGLLYLVIQK
jgi:hypothetical protein